MEHFAHRIKLKDNINTDNIIPDRHRLACENKAEYAKFVFCDIEKDFHANIKEGDFLIAGENFGCGSSKEYAPIALKELGLRAVIAKSFARIFYRNSFNVGLLLLECNTNYIDDGDNLELHTDKHIIKNLSKGINVSIKPLPLVVRKIIQDNGVIEHIKKNGGFRIEL
jgi:3-isopropylmalate/(R)-2-methylmalate dehydratase small subunit